MAKEKYPLVAKVQFQSDRPNGQCKNKTHFHHFSREFDWQHSIRYSTAADHGKSPAGGIGSINIIGNRAVTRGDNVICAEDRR